MAQTTDAVGFQTQSSWDYALELMTASTDANGVTLHVQFDPLGRTTETWHTSSALPSTKIDDVTFSIFLDAGGSYVQATSTALDSYARSFIDGLGRVTYQQQTASPDLSGGTPVARTVALATAYATIDGQPSGRSQRFDQKKGIGLTESFLYNDASQLAVHTLFNGTDTETTSLAVDGTGLQLSLKTIATDAKGVARATVTNGLGQITRIDEGPANAPVSTYYQHDVAGALLWSKDALGHVISYTNDAVGRVTQVTDADRGTISTDYDAAGNVVEQDYPCSNSDGDSHCSNLRGYDALNRLVEELTLDGGGVLPIQIDIRNYDETGSVFGTGTAHHLTSIINNVTTCPDVDSNVRTTRLTYDALGNHAATWRCLDADNNKTWELRDDNMPTVSLPVERLRSVTYPSGEVVSYGYDDASRVSSVTGVLPSVNDGGPPTTVPYVKSMGYDEAGHLLSASYGNGVSETYTYTPDEKLLWTAHIANATDTLYDASYTYYSNDLVASAAYSAGPRAGLSLSYDYDGFNRLSDVGGSRTESFGYDSIGNLASATIANSGAVRTFGFGGSQPHAATSASWTDTEGSHAASMTYDAAGRLTSYTDGGDIRNFAWDVRGKLAQASASSTLTMTYDADGQRTTVSDGTHTTYYPFPEIVSDEKGDRVCYSDSLRTFACRSATDGLVYLHADRLGSNVLATDENGQLKTSFDYSAFGTRLTAATDDPALAAKRTFTGAVQEDATSPVPGAGLISMGARFYSPEFGRFISPDMLGQSGVIGLNPYQYADGNPISNVDPTGNQAEDTSDDAAAGSDAEPPPTLGTYGVFGGFSSGADSGGNYSVSLSADDIEAYASYIAANPASAASIGADSLTIPGTPGAQSASPTRITAGLNGLIGGGVLAAVGDSIGSLAGWAGACSDPLDCEAIGIVGGATLNSGLPIRVGGLRGRGSAEADAGGNAGGAGFEFTASSPVLKQFGRYGCALAVCQYLIGNGPGAGGYISQYQIGKQIADLRLGLSPDIPFDHPGSAASGGASASELALILQANTGMNYRAGAVHSRGGVSVDLSTLPTPFHIMIGNADIGYHALLVMDFQNGNAILYDPGYPQTSPGLISTETLHTIAVAFTAIRP